MCAACSATDWRMVPTLPAEFEIRRRISRIADSSLASRAASDSWLAADELRGRVVSARLRPFRVAAFRRRDLIDAAPALERRLIALPWLNRTHHSGLGRIVHHSKFGRPMSALGHSRQIDSLVTLAACPLRSESGQIAVNLSMSALCQKRTHALQRNDAMGLNPRPMVPLMHPWLANRVGQRAWYRPAGQSE